MGRLVVNNAMTVNGAFEAPVPEPDGWLVLDPDSNNVSLGSSWWPTRWCWDARPARAWPRSGRNSWTTRPLGCSPSG